MVPDEETARTDAPPEDVTGTGDVVPPSETAEDATGGEAAAEAPEGAPEGAEEVPEAPGEDAPTKGADEADDDGADALRAELEAVRRELEEAKEARAAAERKGEEYLALAKRTRADLDNFRRRTQQDAEAAVARAKAGVLTEILTIMDNFDRALEHAGDEESLYDGLKLIYRQLRSVVEAQGLRRVDAEGHAFDPLVHEAVMREPTTAYKEGVVIKEFEKGYFLGEKLLRPAKVKVAVAPPEADDAEGGDDSSGGAPDESGSTRGE